MIGFVLKAAGVGAKLAHRFASRAARDRERMAHMDVVYQAGLQGFDVPRELGTPKDPLDWLKNQAANSATAKGKAYAAQLYHELAAHQHTKHAKAAGTLADVGAFAATPGGSRAVGAVATAAIRGITRTQRRSYIDQFGRRRYRNVAVSEAADIGGGEATGALGATGATAAGVGVGGAALAGAAGIGAYLVTSKVLEHLGNQQLDREDAVVQADLALRDAFETYRAQHGAYPPPDERARMKQAWAAEITNLGYPATWFGKAFSDFIRDYATEE